MDLPQFEEAFGRGSIRADFNWSRLRQPGRPGPLTITEEVVSSGVRLASFPIVWYADHAGMPASHDQPNAVALRVGDAARLAGCPTGPGGWTARRARIAELRTSLLAEPTPPVLALPAYRLPGDRGPLLLDGTHRVVAAVGAGVPVVAILFILVGPLDPAILPDLRHHTGMPGPDRSG